MVQSSKEKNTSPAPRACCGVDIGRLFTPGFFRAFADPSRVVLFSRLAAEQRPLSVSELAGCCPTDLSVVSRHLSMLRDAGVIESRKEGRRVLYTMRYRELSDALRAMADAIDACCPPPSREAGANEGDEEVR